MSAETFNNKQLVDSKMSLTHLTALVEFWQRHHDLAVDGYAGGNTIASIDKALGVDQAIAKIWPLPPLADGRIPKITSGFYTENPSRSSHKGVDMFYQWRDSDPDVPTGDGGAIKRNGKRRWWYPEGAVAVAAADGVVQKAGNWKTGWRCWVDHGNGERTGYFHGAQVLVTEGQIVAAGDPLILIGDNPLGHDGKHLHFEVSPVDRYAPKNPRTWLKDAKHRKLDQ